MNIKTSELTGAALDWAVAKCEGKATGFEYTLNEAIVLVGLDQYSPSELWAQGGPIIEREKIGTDYAQEEDWAARTPEYQWAYGPTPLSAAMRCYVASKLGDEVEVPDELTSQL